MSYIGSQPADSYLALSKQDFTTSATTTYTLSNSVTSSSDIALFINFVRQEPETAYTASGVNLNLTEATSASDDMYCIYLGRTVGTINPPNGSVGTAQIADLAVTSGKLASGVLPTNTPAFEASLSAHQSINDITNTKVQFNTEIFDTDNCYDNTTNYRFTPTTAGKYFCYTSLRGAPTSGTGALEKLSAGFFLNGSSYGAQLRQGDRNSNGTLASVTLTTVIDFNGTTDYLEVYGNVDVSSGTPAFYNVSTLFGAYKLIGV